MSKSWTWSSFSSSSSNLKLAIVPYLLPSCVNVRCQWKINRTPFFSFVKAAQRLLSLRFGIRSRCFFQKKISKMTFFSFEWS